MTHESASPTVGMGIATVWLAAIAAYSLFLLYRFLAPCLGRWYRAWQRGFDLRVLWPACYKKAPDLDHAKAAFACHAFHDEAWTRDFTHDELIEYISHLGAP